MMKSAVPPAFALLALMVAALGGIDSGGGKSSIDSETLWSSIGSPFATGQAAVGGEYMFPGQIEVVYARANPTDADIDGDGIPDFWGRFHYGTPRLNRSNDGDGDGANNFLEYVAGTNPRLRSSSTHPRHSYGNGSFIMDFTTAVGRTYRIWWSADLRSTWSLFESHQGTGFDLRSVFLPQVHDPLYATRSARPRYFFRIEVLKP